MNKTFVASISLYAIFALHANAQALPAAPAEWTYSAIPTVSTNTQPTFTAWPTISIPASTGVKHVVDCISVEIGVTNGQSGYYTVLQLEDGVAGSNPLMRWSFLPSSTTQQSLHLCGLSVVGTAGSAMTLRFVPGGNYYGYSNYEFASLNLVGHDAQ